MLNLLKDLKRELGLTYLFISHNLAVVDYVADRIAVLANGRIVEIAPRELLFSKPVHSYTQALHARRAVPGPRPAARLQPLADGSASDPEQLGAAFQDEGDPPGSYRSTSAMATSCWPGRPSTGGSSSLEGRSSFSALLRVLVARRASRAHRPRCPVETPLFEADVAAGKLPPVGDRLPEHAAGRRPQGHGTRDGEPGGTWRMLMGDQRDLRMMTVYSYARLVVFDEKLNLVPDILREPRDPGRQGLHAASARGPQVVGRPALHGRRLPLLLGRRRQQSEACHPRDRTSPCWPTASRRNSRCSIR